MSAFTDGLLKKYHVERTDGSSEPWNKHEHCEYFVLDIEHDPHAIAALEAYRESCKGEYPVLADDLAKMLNRAKVKLYLKGSS